MQERSELLTQLAMPLAEDRAAAEVYAAHLEELVEQMLPERLGKAYQAALAQGDVEGCLKAATAYFRARPACPLYPADAPYDKALADRSANGVMYEVNQEWAFPDGRVDFLFNATAVKGPLSHEWQWQLSRHRFWPDMARAWAATGESRYATAFCRQLLDWIAVTRVTPDWNGPGSAWRTIECGIRLGGSWQIAFDIFRKAPEVPDMAVLLMVASMHRQAAHLIAHPTTENWLMMEMNGAFTFASLFPEMRDAEAFGRIAAERFLAELKGQVLPDGMQNELSPDYHSVVLHCAANFYDVAAATGKEATLPDGFQKLMTDMVHSCILLSTPGFTQPRTNDCYTLFTKNYIRRAAALVGDDPVCRFVMSDRQEGTPPTGETASVLLPYAGFAVMRSDWGADASYLCFDVGPLGMGHMHQDKLNINLYQGSEELIYDDGGGQYEISDARVYAVSGYAHNIVLVDGMAQQRTAPMESEQPIDAGFISNERFDYACGVYDDGFGPEEAEPATHKREVRFCKPGLYALADTLTAKDGAAHTYEQLFHLDTTRVQSVPALPGAVLSDFGRQYEVLIVPVDCEAAPEVVSAQQQPVFQGWYAGRNEAVLHPATAVSYKRTGETCRFETLLIPVKRGSALPTVQKQGSVVKVTLEGREYTVDFRALNQ